MADKQEITQLNQAVNEWAKLQSQRMRRLVGSLTLRDKVAVRKAIQHAIKNDGYRPLAASIGGAVKKEFGDPVRINFRFPRHGVFFERGVGRGRGVGSSKTNPKPWLKPVLDPAIDQLADILAENYADIGASEIKFVIPGIIDRRIQINNG